MPKKRVRSKTYAIAVAYSRLGETERKLVVRTRYGRRDLLAVARRIPRIWGELLDSAEVPWRDLKRIADTANPAERLRRYREVCAKHGLALENEGA